jgi:hypothetical protein
MSRSNTKLVASEFPKKSIFPSPGFAGSRGGPQEFGAGIVLIEGAANEGCAKAADARQTTDRFL